MHPQFRVVHGTVSNGDGKTVPVKIIKVDDRLPASLIEKGDEPLISISTQYVKATDNKKDHPYFDLSKKTAAKELEHGDEVVFLVSIESGRIVWLCWTYKSDFLAAQQAITARKNGRQNVIHFVPEDNATYRLYFEKTPFVGTPLAIRNELTRDYHHKESSWPKADSWEKHNGRKFISCEPPACPPINTFLAGCKQTA